MWVAWLCFVAQDDAVEAQFIMDHAAQVCRNRRIMVSDNPAPIMFSGQLAQKECRRILQPRPPPLVVKIVAQAVNCRNIMLAGQSRQFFERGPAIIRRQELAAHSIARRLFQMQVRNQQRSAQRPV